MPGLPKVPSVDNLMPTFSGLLSTGHSTVEPHQLGAMLRLPPMSASGVPTWEGIVITDAIPGRPHAVEVAYPSDQHVAVGLSILEQSLVIRLFQFGMTVGSRCRNQLLVRQQYFVGIVLFSGLELNHRCW